MGNGVNSQGRRQWPRGTEAQGKWGWWGEALKRRKMRLQKFPGQRARRVIFPERFETPHCLKLKRMWDRML